MHPGRSLRTGESRPGAQALAGRAGTLAVLVAWLLLASSSATPLVAQEGDFGLRVGVGPVLTAGLPGMAPGLTGRLGGRVHGHQVAVRVG
ncbi:MAG TPA: hypothetical protein RMF84_15990, partial [Polyangiaceae bacterium LLY-WYZ-14_1]|nr:hypothetical protein [Polyangiaceae bacterium LLY-WYZ-14_1]